MLTLKNISMQYEGSNNLILNNINLSFGENGLVSILGPSGCGKTTLLNIIGGLDKPTNGSVLIDGYDITKLKRKELDKYHNRIIGFVYQNYNLIDYLNVVDNIELINKNIYIKELLEQFNLSNKKYKKIKHLSGGEKQRVAIARSISNNPKILLCDEPTGALDTKTGHTIMKFLKSISSEILVIMVTHNKELANTYSDRIISLEDGNIVYDSNTYEESSYEIKSFSKTKIKITRILNIILKNLQSKYKRNILSVIAFSVGLISLGLVLGISSGFNKSMELEEKNSLSKYPIYISETSTNLDNELNNIFEEKNNIEDEYIYKKENGHINKLDFEYINSLSKIDEFLNYQINTYLIQDKIINVSDKKIKELEIIKGHNIENKNEIILIATNNTVDENILRSLNLSGNKFSFDEILNREIKIKKEKYKVVGIAKVNEDSYLNTLSGLLSISDFPKQIPLNISLYPKDYESKKNVLNHLNNYKEIEYTDYSSSIKNLSKTLMNGITIILLSFSTISLLVSTIMIGIVSYISVLERIKEIGLFKSLGLSNFYVKNIFLVENIILGIIASILSFIVCKISSIPINNLLTSLTGMNNILLINSKLLITLLCISISLSIIGSYLPIRKTKKLKIIDCLKYE